MPTTDFEDGNAAATATTWLAHDPASDLRLALDALDGKPVPQAELMLRWAVAHSYDGVVFRGHTDWVTNAVVSPGWDYLLTTSFDKTVKMWNMASGDLLAMFAIGVRSWLPPRFSPDVTRILVIGVDHKVYVGQWKDDAQLVPLPVSQDLPVNAAAFAPRGLRVLTGHVNGTARVSSPDAEILVLGAPNDNPIHSVAFDPTGDLAATGSKLGKVWLWDLRRPGRPLVLAGHTGMVRTVAFSPKGDRLVTASDDGTAQLFAVPSGEPVAVLEGHSDVVTSAEFNEGGEMVATASADKTARVYDARSGRPVVVHRGATDAVNAVRFSPDGRLLATASSDGVGRVSYTGTGGLLAELRGHAGPVFSVDFAGNKSVVTGSADGTARRWDLGSGVVFWGHRDAVLSAAWSPNGQWVVTGSQDGTARVYKADTAEQLAVLGEHDEAVNDAAISADGRFVATASSDTTARITEWQASVPSLRLPHTTLVNMVEFDATGDRLVTTTIYEAVVWDRQSGERLSTIRLPQAVTDANPLAYIASATFSPDNRTVLTAQFDKTARFWDVTTPVARELRSLEGHSGVVYSAVYNHDGTQALTASGDGSARVWNVADGRLLHVLVGPSGQLRAASFSPDGARVVAAAADGTTVVFEVASERVLAVLHHHSDLVNTAVFSPNGRKLLTASDDRTAKAYDCESCGPLEDVLAVARQRQQLAPGDP